MCLIYNGYEMLEIRFWPDRIFKINIIKMTKERSIKTGIVVL